MLTGSAENRRVEPSPMRRARRACLPHYRHFAGAPRARRGLAWLKDIRHAENLAVGTVLVTTIGSAFAVSDDGRTGVRVIAGKARQSRARRCSRVGRLSFHVAISSGGARPMRCGTDRCSIASPHRGAVVKVAPARRCPHQGRSGGSCESRRAGRAARSSGETRLA